MKSLYNLANAQDAPSSQSTHVLIHDVARRLCLPTYAIKRLMEHVRELETSNKPQVQTTPFEEDPMPGYMSRNQIAQVEAILYRLTHDDAPVVELEKGKVAKLAALDSMPFLNTLPSQSELYRQLMVSHRGAIN